MTFLDLEPSDAIAAIDAASGESLTYRGLIDSAGSIADHLGQGKQLIFVLSRNDMLSGTAYAATQLAGHALALLDGSKPVTGHGDVIAEYRPAWVIGPEGTADALKDGCLSPERVEAIPGGELIAMADGERTDLHPDLAVMMATSGTTGSRKYVRLSAASVEANARSIAQYLELTPHERPITSLPLHYSFGLSVLNSHWLSGATVVFSGESVMQRGFWEAVAEYRCSSVAGVPYTYQMLERIGYRDMDLPSVHTMQQAGGALDRRLTSLYSDHMNRKGGRFFVMYGQTEATARIAFVPPDRLPGKLGSAGMAIPGGHLRIDVTGGAEPGQPAIGEVIYEGPNVMLGYAERQKDLKSGDELGGVLRTGDIGYLDDEGFLFLTGRSKRIAKVFGLRINLDEVELMLRESGPAAVIASDDVIRGFCAFGTDESVAELRESLSRRLRIHRSALDLRRVADIPVSTIGQGRLPTGRTMDHGLEELLVAEQYSVAAAQKAPIMVAGLERLTESHRERCEPYARILSAWQSPGTRGPRAEAGEGLATVPYLPSALFKSLELRSVPEDEVFKVMTSSGTTGQTPSRVYLDVETARLQSRALSRIVTHFLGPARRPMLIVDDAEVIRDRQRFSARAAGIKGMMTYGRDHLFGLDRHMRLRRSELESWLTRHADEDLLVFGFTFMIWHDFLQPLRDAGLDLSRAALVHSGGWKKLADEAVSREDFKSGLSASLGITRVHDFYGMVEQVGSVYFECAAGYFHAPNFADVIVRDPTSWGPAEQGTVGVIEVLSLLPLSYPGHALLTEDLGIVHGVDDCTCGQLGTRFSLEGRVPKAEIRGCSDTQVRG